MGKVTLMYAGKRDEDRSRLKKRLKMLQSFLRIGSRQKVFVLSKDAVNAIAREAYEHDIVLIGASNRPFLKNFLLGTC